MTLQIIMISSKYNTIKGTITIRKSSSIIIDGYSAEIAVIDPIIEISKIKANVYGVNR